MPYITSENAAITAERTRSFQNSIRADGYLLSVRV